MKYLCLLILLFANVCYAEVYTNEDVKEIDVSKTNDGVAGDIVDGAIYGNGTFTYSDGVKLKVKWEDVN